MAGSNAKYSYLTGSQLEDDLGPQGTFDNAEAIFGCHTAGADDRPHGRALIGPNVRRARGEKAWLPLFKKWPSCPLGWLSQH